MGLEFRSDPLLLGTPAKTGVVAGSNVVGVK
jgi:hypothetical protein